MELKAVAFETARKLRDVGFDPYRDWKGKFYWSDSERPEQLTDKWHYMEWVDLFPAPTQELVRMWLREKHNIQMSLQSTGIGKHVKYRWTVSKFGIYPNGDAGRFKNTFTDWFISYNEALEVGISEALNIIQK